MAGVQHFRSAFHGFNREDVVHYIEYLNNQHNAKIEQLNSQLLAAQEKAAPADVEELRTQLDEALARCAELEAALAEQEPVPASANCTEEELEAYRRAERTERVARERAQQIYDQANAVLADVTLKAETASKQVNALADQVAVQMQAYQNSITDTKDAFQEAVATLYAIRPEEE